MRAILHIGHTKLLIGKDQNLESVVALAETSLSVKESFQYNTFSPVNGEFIRILLVPDSVIIEKEPEEG